MKAIFLDRDGTVNVGEPRYSRITALDQIELLPNTLAACKLLATLDYGVFFVSNQAGLAEGLLTPEQEVKINDQIIALLEPTGVVILKSYICPHGEDSTCDCRKPKPKLILDAAKEYDIDLADSWMIGDRATDVQAGINAGTKTILVQTGVPNVQSDQATSTAPSLLEAAQYIARRS